MLDKVSELGASGIRVVTGFGRSLLMLVGACVIAHNLSKTFHC